MWQGRAVLEGVLTPEKVPEGGAAGHVLEENRDLARVQNRGGNIPSWRE